MQSHQVPTGQELRNPEELSAIDAVINFLMVLAVLLIDPLILVDLYLCHIDAIYKLRLYMRSKTVINLSTDGTTRLGASKTTEIHFWCLMHLQYKTKFKVIL